MRQRYLSRPRVDERARAGARRFDASLQADEDASLVCVVQRHAQRRPEHPVLRWHDTDGQEQTRLTYATLWAASGAVAELVASHGAKPGDRVMIAYPFGLDFVPGMCPACVGCGARCP